MPSARPLPLLAAVALTLAAAGAPNAQEPVETQSFRPPDAANPLAIVHAERNFRGAGVAVTDARPNLALSWPVRSLRVERGQWQLCSLPNYLGQCVTATQSYADLSQLGVSRVLSMRPAPGGADTGNPGPSLHGMASEFFRAPRENGQRVQACPGGQAAAACSQRSADRFCQRRGWTRAAWNLMETEGRNVFLADVLCTRQR